MALRLAALGWHSAAGVQLPEQEANPSAQGFSPGESPAFGQQRAQAAAFR